MEFTIITELSVITAVKKSKLYTSSCYSVDFEFLDRAVLIFLTNPWAGVTESWKTLRFESSFFYVVLILHDLKCVFNSSAEVKSRTEGNESWRPLVTCLLFIDPFFLSLLKCEMKFWL